MGRFAMAAFLLDIGIGEDDLLRMFKAFTDFDERLARYQVEHIAGKHGSKTEIYSTQLRNYANSWTVY